MGHKVSPQGLRVGGVVNWSSIWYAEKNYAQTLYEDVKIRNYIKNHFKSAGIPKIEINRLVDQIVVDIHSARPGIVIGRGGSEVDRLRERIQEMVGNKEIAINVREIKNPSVDAQLIAENIALQLERRVRFRIAMKRAISQAMNAGVKGIKVKCKGRLSGLEMSSAEEYKEGKIPLHTLRALIDYGFSEAETLYGMIGVKVWVYKGEVLREKQGPTPKLAKEEEKR